MNAIFHCRILDPELPAGFSSAPSYHSVWCLMLPKAYITMQAVQVLGGSLHWYPVPACHVLIQPGKIKNCDQAWGSTEQSSKGGQPKRQHNSHWSASTCWIALKDSSSFKTDGTYSQSAIQPTAGFPFCFDPSVVWLLMNKSEDSSLPEAFWARAKTEPEASVTHWPNSGIILYMLL